MPHRIPSIWTCFQQNESWLLSQDNAPITLHLKQFLAHEVIKMQLPPHSQYLALVHFFLFPKTDSFFEGKKILAY